MRHDVRKAVIVDERVAMLTETLPLTIPSI